MGFPVATPINQKTIKNSQKDKSIEIKQLFSPLKL